MTGRRSPLFLAFAFLGALALQAQETESLDQPVSAAAASPFSFGFNLGTDVLPVPGDLTGATESYQRVALSPELNLGNFGIGLDILFRFQLLFGDDDPFKVYLPDWWPNYLGNGRSFWEIYLPKIMYLRYGQRGSPLYAKLGSIDDMTLGNGFIMGNYSNTRFMPDFRKFGAQLGVDGKLFKFPYVGIEAAVGDLAALDFVNEEYDVVGGRVFFRPLAWMKVPVLPELQIGASAVLDMDPYRYGGLPGALTEARVWGMDARLPVIGGKIFPMVAMADLAFQEGGRVGGMTGVAGKLLGFILYNAQIRYLTDGFVPAYFDASYDLYRAYRLQAMEVASSGATTVAWFAQAGFSLMEDKIVFGMGIDGPFAAPPAVPTLNQADYPHIRASISTAEGLLAGFSLSGSYEKYFIGQGGDAWGELISPENAQIQAKLDYKTGGAILSLLYNLSYDPVTSEFDVTSSLQTAFKF